MWRFVHRQFVHHECYHEYLRSGRDTRPTGNVRQLPHVLEHADRQVVRAVWVSYSTVLNESENPRSKSLASIRRCSCAKGSGSGIDGWKAETRESGISRAASLYTVIYSTQADCFKSNGSQNSRWMIREVGESVYRAELKRHSDWFFVVSEERERLPSRLVKVKG